MSIILIKHQKGQQVVNFNDQIFGQTFQLWFQLGSACHHAHRNNLIWWGGTGCEAFFMIPDRVCIHPHQTGCVVEVREVQLYKILWPGLLAANINKTEQTYNFTSILRFYLQSNGELLAPQLFVLAGLTELHLLLKCTMGLKPLHAKKINSWYSLTYTCVLVLN